VIHFDSEPPAHAFWSLTAYDREAFLMANEIDRFGIRGRDDFARNADGSFDIHLGAICPSSCDSRNWIPTQPGRISLTLRLYMPSGDFLNGSWTPPPISAVTTSVR
jgi:hypothetical protein